jgi:hypothetical protein
MASAWQIFPGPPARSPGFGIRAHPRFSRIRSSPSTGSPARSSTALPTPASPVTAFRQ